MTTDASKPAIIGPTGKISRLAAAHTASQLCTTFRSFGCGVEHHRDIEAWVVQWPASSLFNSCTTAAVSAIHPEGRQEQADVLEGY
jgi:hypothetical protein